MLEALLRFLNNWFVLETRSQGFTITGGSITPPFLQDGQYFRIRGSVFNDGLHQYPATDLKDEIFYGSIDALAVPKAVIELAGEMAAWQKKYGDRAQAPYTAESFAGYSYTKASAATNGGDATVWSVFQAQMSKWRKI